MAWGDDAWGDAEWGGTSSTTRIAGTYGLSRAYNGDQYAGQPLISQAQLPTAPINFVAVLGIASYVNLSWVGSANTVTYELQRSTDSGSTWTSLSSTLVSPFYTDTNTLFGTTYTYRVRGINSVGSGSWAPNVTLTPVGDDGDWLYFNANLIPNLVEADGDWVYLNASLIPNLIEADGDWLYLNANITGFLVTLIPGAYWRASENVGFPISPDPNAYWRALENVGFPVPVIPDAVWLGYENIGFPVPVAPAAFWLAYENVGALGGRKQPTPVWGVGFLRIAPRDIDPITVATFYAMVDVTI